MRLKRYLTEAKQPFVLQEFLFGWYDVKFFKTFKEASTFAQKKYDNAVKRNKKAEKDWRPNSYGKEQIHPMRIVDTTIVPPKYSPGTKADWKDWKSNKKNYLTEKWKKSFKSIRVPSGIVEVFVNPTKSEFRDAAGTNSWDHLKGKWVRFFADLDTKLVHVWHPEIIHSDMWKRIGTGGKDYNDDTLMSGVAENVGGKWTLTETDEGIAKNLYGYDVRDWKWVDKWISVTKKLKEVQKELDAGTYRGN